MAYDIFSGRTKRSKWLQIEQYYEIPKTLRNQIFSVLEQIIVSSEWENLWHAFCDEKGKDHEEKNINGDYDFNNPDDCDEFTKAYRLRCYKQIKEGAIEDVFDMIDIAFQMTSKDIENTPIQHQKNLRNKLEKYHQAIKDINIRFERENVGYRIENNQIERKTLNLDLALPALDLLRDENFKHARNNFYLAHRSYQNKNYGECVVNASKSFEDLLKALCAQQELEHDPEGSTENLVKVLCEDLFSSSKFNKKFSQSFKFLPDVRAHFGGHGSAPEDKETPDFMARYALHLVATNILFFIQAVGPKKPSETEDETSTDETSSNNSGGGDLDDDIPF